MTSLPLTDRRLDGISFSLTLMLLSFWPTHHFQHFLCTPGSPFIHISSGAGYLAVSSPLGLSQVRPELSHLFSWTLVPIPRASRPPFLSPSSLSPPKALIPFPLVTEHHLLRILQKLQPQRVSNCSLYLLLLILLCCSRDCTMPYQGTPVRSPKGQRSLVPPPLKFAELLKSWLEVMLSPSCSLPTPTSGLSHLCPDWSQSPFAFWFTPFWYVFSLC